MTKMQSLAAAACAVIVAGLSTWATLRGDRHPQFAPSPLSQSFGPAEVMKSSRDLPAPKYDLF